MILANIVILLVSFFVLIKGANYLVEGASSIATRMKISGLVIGLTIVAFGTSAPELAVNVFSAIQGATQVAIGNILGSNMANILLVLGIAAIIGTLTVQKQTVVKEIPFSLLAALIVLIFVSDVFLDRASVDVISRTDGLAMLGFFIIFMYYTYFASKAVPEETHQHKALATHLSVIYILGGLLALFVGGHLIVQNAVSIASVLGVSQSIIGLTIVALGTSLPELVTAIVAVRQGKSDIAVGGVVGSNIFNIFLVLGLTATISPITFDHINFSDTLMTIVASLLLFVTMYLGARHRIDRWAGIMFVALYVIYISFRVLEAIV
ncbi:MAG: calcium/sodium antiporter [Candidatus Uhrbacteria bacterium]